MICTFFDSCGENFTAKINLERAVVFFWRRERAARVVHSRTPSKPKKIQRVHVRRSKQGRNATVASNIVVVVSIAVACLAFLFSSSKTISKKEIAQWSSNRTFVVTGTNSGICHVSIAMAYCRSSERCDTAKREIVGDFFRYTKRLTLDLRPHFRKKLK
jgi:hypothetical protein